MWKAKWLSEEALQIAEKREVKGKGERGIYTQLNAEFQRIASRHKKTFLRDQCREIEVNNRMGKNSQFSHSVVSDSLWSHGLQHIRLPCPSPTPEACSNSCPSSQWCHPTMSSSVVPFSSCPQSFPASGSFSVSQFFASGGQTIEVSALASFLPKNTQGWSPSEWTGWISLQSKALSRVFSNTTVQRHQFFGTQLSL